MKNSPENRHFEEQWKKAFDSGELTPSPNVWKGIDAHLANQQAGTYKRSALIYRWVAAASVAILLGWTGYYLSNRPARVENISLDEDMPAVSNEINQAPTDVIPNETDVTSGENSSILDKGTERDIKDGTEQDSDTPGKLREGAYSPGYLATEDGDSKSPSNSIAPQNDESGVKQSLGDGKALMTEEAESAATGNTLLIAEGSGTEENPSETNEESLLAHGRQTGLVSGTDPLGFDLLESDRADMEPEGMPVWDFEIIGKDKDEPEGLFAGLNFAPGVFDPNFSNTVAAAESLSQDSFINPVSPSVTESDVNQGFSYGFGINTGLPLGKKWVIQGGLEYSVGRSETSTSLIVESAAGGRSALTFTNSDQAEALNNTVSVSSPSDVTSSYQFLSVPLKAGYSILDEKKFGLLLSAGVSSDIFLSNTISSSQEGVQTFRQSAGSDSPFRSVYFSGLSSLMLSYKINSSYLLLLEPSYKMALSDFSKSSELFKSRPNSFGIGLGIRYQFK